MDSVTFHRLKGETRREGRHLNPQDLVKQLRAHLENDESEFTVQSAWALGYACELEDRFEGGRR